MIAQDGAKPGSPIRASLRELGWEAESWVGWEMRLSPPGDDTVLISLFQAVRKCCNIKFGSSRSLHDLRRQ